MLMWMTMTRPGQLFGASFMYILCITDYVGLWWFWLIFFVVYVHLFLKEVDE